MILLAAPSKTQKTPAQGNPVYRNFTIPQSLERTAQLIAALRQLTEGQLAELMKTSARLTGKTARQIHEFSIPFTPENASHAIRTFRGDLYEAIRAEEYTEAQLDYAQNHFAILSGLYGLLRPLDLLQPYRLEMGTTFAFSEYKNLYQFWREDITTKLLGQLMQDGDTTLINLASVEYAKVLDKKQLSRRGVHTIEIVFQQPHPKGIDGYKTIPIYSKRARGEMIHFAICRTICQAEDLLAFTVDGYSFIENESTAEKWLFRKG